MIYTQLGQIPFKVSRICFGALTIGPLQANLSLSEGADVIRTAFDYGINFIDTAEMYLTYPYIKEALKGINSDIVIATKSYAYTKELMAKSLEKARKELDRDVIEIFMLHEQESDLTLKGHWEAMEFLLNAKAKGIVGAVGISTHAVEGVTAASKIKEIDVIHPMLNKKGIGIIDGDINKMTEAVQQAFKEGKGIYGMKAIGGGNLIGNVQQALEWAFQFEWAHSIAIGMKTPAEVHVNVAWLLGEQPDEEILRQVKLEKRKLHIEDWCSGCGACVQGCPQKALEIVNKKATVDIENCVLCGYCGAYCPDFCIKVI